MIVLLTKYNKRTGERGFANVPGFLSMFPDVPSANEEAANLNAVSEEIEYGTLALPPANQLTRDMLLNCSQRLVEGFLGVYDSGFTLPGKSWSHDRLSARYTGFVQMLEHRLAADAIKAEIGGTAFDAAVLFPSTAPADVKEKVEQWCDLCNKANEIWYKQW